MRKPLAFLYFLVATLGAPREAVAQRADAVGVAVAAPISGGPAGDTTREARVRRAVNLRAALLVVDDQLRNGLIAPEQAARARAFYLDEARARLGGGPFASPADLEAYAAAQHGVVRRSAGLASFTSLLLTLAAIVTAVALGWLFRSYFAKLPLWGYELAAYALAGALIGRGGALGRALGIGGSYVAMVGCLAFLAAVILTYATRVLPGLMKDGKAELERVVMARTWRGMFLTPVNFVGAACALAWGLTALHYQSVQIAAGATVALISAVGFTIFVTPLCYYFGYSDEEKIPLTMLTALAMVGAYLAAEAGPVALGSAAVFTKPLAWVGSLVYFVSLLIVASRWHRSGRRGGAARSWRRFWEWQAIAVLSFGAGLYLGPVLGAPVLSGVAGTLFAFYLVEKYMEIPWRGRGWAWSALGAGCLLYAIGRAAGRWPEYFLW